MEDRKPLPPSAFDEYKLRLIGPVVANAERPATLAVKVIKNQPRIDVYTNVPNDRDYGRIGAPMDGGTFFTFLVMLEEIIAGPADTQNQIQNLTGRPEEQRIISTTVFGKDKEGRVYISITAADRPKIKFVFRPTTYHILMDRDGNPLDEAKVSVLHSKGWVQLLYNLVPNVMDTNYEKREYGNAPQQNSGGRNYNDSGYGNKDYSNKGYQGGGARPSAIQNPVVTDEDDVAF